MKRLLFALFLLFTSQVSSVQLFDPGEITPITHDEELISLWNSLDDLYDPTLSDCAKINDYLRYGKRPYLDHLLAHIKEREVINRTKHPTLPPYRVDQRTHKRFSLVDPNGQKPVMKIEYLGGASKEDKSRCVIMFASFNSDDLDQKDYQKKLEHVVQDLKREGFKGHVIYRLGKYPLIERGSARMVHIPYSFKVLAFIEASLMGYSNVLWLDCSIHPTTNLSTVFSHIEKHGIYLLRTGIKLDKLHDLGYLPDYIMQATDLTKEELCKIPHIAAATIGVSFDTLRGVSFIQEWYHLTELSTPSMSLFPEEFLLSLVCWKLKCNPYGLFRSQIYESGLYKTKPPCPSKPFWFDKS